MESFSPSTEVLSGALSDMKIVSATFGFYYGDHYHCGVGGLVRLRFAGGVFFNDLNKLIL